MSDKKQSAAAEYYGRDLIRQARGVKQDVLTLVLAPNKKYTRERARELTEKILKKEIN